MTIAELAKIVEGLQALVNKACEKFDTAMNGKEGVFTTLATYDGRLKRLEDNDTRRQKIVDSLTAGVGLVILLEIFRYVFGVP
jgi:hypothetical protein